MNRSLANVILGGYSITAKEVAEKGEAQSHQETDISGAVDAITNARSVIIVPGYGLAVASAQYAIADLVKTLTSRDIKVRSAGSHTHLDSFADAAVQSLDVQLLVSRAASVSGDCVYASIHAVVGSIAVLLMLHAASNF